MREDRITSAVAKTIWLSWTAAEISSTLASETMRLNSCSARAGTLASNSPVTDLSRGASRTLRSEEHTSELQSLRHLVCRLLLEKKNRQSSSTVCRSTRNNSSPHTVP